MEKRNNFLIQTKVLFIRGLLLFVATFSFGAAHSGCIYLERGENNASPLSSEIQSLEVNIPKAKKWVKNTYAILLDEGRAIKKNNKEYFKATIKVQYSDRLCEFKAKVRQNGDWKDHISQNEYGQTVSSIDVKLEEGHIKNAVAFKLLIPKTRKNDNEILMVSLLQTLGFIVPNTFIVNAQVNGVFSKYIFQEKDRKEMIERNNRREGPLFEGDESLLFAENSGNLVPLSLVRLTNQKWASRGISSTQMSLEAFVELQNSYLRYSGKGKGFFHAPDRDVEKFALYEIILLSAGGWHALRGHNRKFYFNAIEQSFEPIYYDGNISFPTLESERHNHVLETIGGLTDLLNNQVLENFLGKIKSDDFKNKVFENYKLRTGNYSEYSQADVQSKLANLSNNLLAAKSLSKKVVGNNLESIATLQEKFLQHASALKFSVYPYFFDYSYRGNSVALNVLNGGETQYFDIKTVSEMMSKNTLNGQRVVIFQQPTMSKSKVNADSYTSHEVGGGLVKIWGDVLTQIDIVKKKITFQQLSPGARVLVQGSDLSGFDIKFSGLPVKKESPQDQRFDSRGLTGCLTFYSVKFNDTILTASDGSCEDSVNIVNSEGSVARLYIQRAFADAFDADFSNLSFLSVLVQGAGNDCVDVSSGRYRFDDLDLTNCLDKSVSVGEGSRVEIGSLKSRESGISLAVKDSSIAKVDFMLNSFTPICISASNKKQEYDGGVVHVGILSCAGSVSHDYASKIFVSVRQ